MQRWGILIAAAALAMSGCAGKSRWTGEIEPQDLISALREPFRIRVRPATAAQKDYVADLERLLREEMRRAENRVAGPDEPGLELEVTITHIAAGGAWGEEAECHLELTWKAPDTGVVGGFKAIGYSGGTWGKDRIATALSQAALAVAQRIAGSRS